MTKPRKYELVYVLSPEVSEDGVTELHKQVEAIVARFEGQIERTDNWGRRKLAYEIGRHKEASYVLEVIDGTGDLMKEIERRLKVNEQVLRYLVVRVDEELKAAERAKARRQVETDRRGARHRTPDAQSAEPAASVDAGEQVEE